MLPVLPLSTWHPLCLNFEYKVPGTRVIVGLFRIKAWKGRDFLVTAIHVGRLEGILGRSLFFLCSRCLAVGVEVGLYWISSSFWSTVKVRVSVEFTMYDIFG